MPGYKRFPFIPSATPYVQVIETGPDVDNSETVFLDSRATLELEERLWVLTRL